MLSVIMLNVANKPLKVTVVMLNVVILSVAAPFGAPTVIFTLKYQTRLKERVKNKHSSSLKILDWVGKTRSKSDRVFVCALSYFNDHR